MTAPLHLGSQVLELPKASGGAALVSGYIKSVPEDFIVEEIPLYRPSGEGEHLYLRVEKRGLSTHDLLRLLASQLGRSERDFGHAGLKDKQAVAVQTLSITGGTEDELRRLDIRGLKILDVSRHANKLRIGHLKGNRFTIRVVGAGAGAAERVGPALAQLTGQGVPNYFGEQRFGIRGSSARVGECLLRGDPAGACDWIMGLSFLGEELSHQQPLAEARRLYQKSDFRRARDVLPTRFREQRRLLGCLSRSRGNPETAVRKLPRNAVRLYLCAYQSELFNVCLARRFPERNVLWEGDLAAIAGKRSVFLVEDAEKEASRAAALEVSPTGPIFGQKMARPRGRMADLESRVFQEARLPDGVFRHPAPGVSLGGARRPLVIPVTEMEHAQSGDDLVLAFFLPRGSYATVLLREFLDFSRPEIPANNTSGASNNALGASNDTPGASVEHARESAARNICVRPAENNCPADPETAAENNCTAAESAPIPTPGED